MTAGHAYGQEADSEDEDKVSGIVVNAVTGAPVARALVHSTDDSFATLTDSGGRFEFKVPKPSADGANSPARQGFWASFAPQSAPLLVRGSAGTPLWLTAQKPGFIDNPAERSPPPNPESNEVTIALTPEALIAGRVALSTGEPALGVSVQLFVRQVRDGVSSWVPRGEERANSNGEFRFSELPAGAYKLVTREILDNDPAATIPGGPVFGFPPVFYPNAPDFSGAETIELTAGETFQSNLSLTHQPYYQVKIPLAEEVAGGVNVMVYLQGKRGPGYSLGYNAAERQIEGALPNGNYVVEAFTYGPSSGSGSVNLRVAGTATAGPALPMTHSASISFSVKEEFGNTKWRGSASWTDGKHNFTFHGPRSYLFASVESVDEFELGRGASLRPPSSANDESLVLENILPGRYWVRLNSQRGYVAEATAGGVDLLHDPLPVEAGGNIAVEVRMRDDFAQLEGSVTGLSARTDAEGSPSPGVLYCVPMPDSPGQFQQGAISSDGTFGTLQVAPGNYRVLAFSKQQSEIPYRDPEAMKAYDGKGPVIHVDGGQKASVQVPMNVVP